MAHYNSGSKQFDGEYAISTDENHHQNSNHQENPNYGGIHNSNAAINISNRSTNVGRFEPD
jgi:hypothetical protein